MVGEPGVDDVDGRRRQVVARAYNVKCPTGVVRTATSSLEETVAGDEITELDSVWIGCTLQPDIDVTGEHDRIGERRQPIQHICKFSEEGGGDR